VDFATSSGNLPTQRTGCIVVGVYEGRKLSPAAMELDAASGHAVRITLSAIEGRMLVEIGRP